MGPFFLRYNWGMSMPATIQREHYAYADGSTQCRGLVCRLASLTLPAPVIVSCHAWGGRDALADAAAERFARMGWISLAADLYGNGKTATERNECSALMTPFMKDRAMLRERLRATVAAAQRIPGADGSRVVVAGFCFGGLCALDAARAAIPGVVGVASFHGLFTPPQLGPQGPIAAKVLVMHGWDDPMAKPDSVLALATELTTAGAKWEIDAYGQTVHGFTNPSAADPASGIVYDALACDRAFARVESFLAECA